MTEPRWLSDSEARAWRGYLNLRTMLDLQIARDLAEDSGLSETDYHVLGTVAASTDGRIRLTELADGLLWSTSRLAHHVERMRTRGLVDKRSLPDNSRAAVITLTAKGRRVIAAAAPRHAESVRRHFVDLLTPRQLATLAAISETVVAHLRDVRAGDETGG